MDLKKLLLLLNDFYPFFYEKRLVLTDPNKNSELLPKNYEIIYLKLFFSIKDWPEYFDNQLKLLVFYYLLLKEIKNFFYANSLNIEDYALSKLKRKNLNCFIRYIGSIELFDLIKEILEIKDKDLSKKIKKLVEEKEQEIQKLKEDLEFIFLFFEHNDFDLKDYLIKKEEEVLSKVYWFLYNRGIIDDFGMESTFEELDFKQINISLEKILVFYLVLLLRPFMEVSEEQILNFFNYLLLSEGEIDRDSLLWFNLIQNLSSLIVSKDEISYFERKERSEEEEFNYKILTKKFKEKKEESLNLLRQIFSNY